MEIMLERDQKLDAKYQELVPYLGQEHITQKGAIIKEMNTFELEVFEVSNQTLSKLDIYWSHFAYTCKM